MGLLDDAIREHLDLKRRRGADPAEVEQQEREALGPVRGAAPATAEQPEPVEAELPDDPDLEPYEDEELPPLPADPEPAPLAEPEHHGAVRAPDPPEHVSQPTQQYSVDDLEVLRRQEERRPEPGPEPAPRAFAEPDEDVVPADEEPEPEDVLDETPEFLQEAPEHDRLWFEQRPPRDFDF